MHWIVNYKMFTESVNQEKWSIMQGSCVIDDRCNGFYIADKCASNYY